MKTAISIPDEVFSAAEKTAKRLGVSRSELYSTAVREYIVSHVAEHITESLDEIYSIEDSAVDPNILRMQTSTLGKEDW